MKNRLFKNIVIILSLFAFIAHSGSHMVHELPHSEYEHICLCDGETHCHSCVGDNMVYNSHTFDINLFDFSLRFVADVTFFVEKNLKQDIPVFATDQLYLHNSTLLI